jgi:hypothetical protein
MISGNTFRASKVAGIIQKEAIHKKWRQINQSMRKPCGSLTVCVKVPTSDGGPREYKTKEGLFDTVSPILLGRFQSVLVAPCHSGTFFKDVGHLVNGPVSQQILEGTYEYPQDLDPATRFLFEEAAHAYLALSPKAIATCITPENFQHFWLTARGGTGLFFSGPHFGHYKAFSFCPDLLLLHAAKLSICARNGVALARWGKQLTVLLEKIIENVFVHKLCTICLLKADFN